MNQISTNYIATRIEIYELISLILSGNSLTELEFVSKANCNSELLKLISKLSRRDLYAILFDRLPESSWDIGLAQNLNTPVTPETLHAFLFSEENRLICELVYAKTFIKNGVEIFIHVNKTAGSTLNTILENRDYTILPGNHDAITISELYSSRKKQPMLLTGHRTLNFYKQNFDLLKANRIYTVIREPVELAISFYNFAFTMADGDNMKWGEMYKDIVTDWRSDDFRESFLKYMNSDFFESNVKNIYRNFFGSNDLRIQDVQNMYDNMFQCGLTLMKPEAVNKFLNNDLKNNSLKVNVSEKLVSKESLGFNIIFSLTKMLHESILFYECLNQFHDWNENGILDLKKII